MASGKNGTEMFRALDWPTFLCNGDGDIRAVFVQIRVQVGHTVDSASISSLDVRSSIRFLVSVYSAIKKRTLLARGNYKDAVTVLVTNIFPMNTSALNSYRDKTRNPLSPPKLYRRKMRKKWKIRTRREEIVIFISFENAYFKMDNVITRIYIHYKTQFFFYV